MIALDFSNHYGTTMCEILWFDLIQFDGHIFFNLVEDICENSTQDVGVSDLSG